MALASTTTTTTPAAKASTTTTFPPITLMMGPGCLHGGPCTGGKCQDGGPCVQGWPEGTGTIETAPGKRDLPYIGSCFTNQMPPADAEFSWCNAAVRLPNSPTTGGVDCVATCRYRYKDPVIPYPPGFSWRAGGQCPPDQSSNVAIYVWGTLSYPPYIQTATVYSDSGCDEIPGVTGVHPQPMGLLKPFALVGELFRKKPPVVVTPRTHHLERVDPIAEP